MQVRVWLAVVAIGSFSECAKILIVFPFPSKSHSILGDSLTGLLLIAGHEVTYVTTHPRKDPPPNLHQVDISENQAQFPVNISNLKAIMDKTVSKNNFTAFSEILINLSKVTFSNENVQKLLQDDEEKFDLVIIEWMFSEVYAGLSAVYDCPYIWLSSVDPHWLVTRLIDEPLNPAYNTDSISGYMPPFTFLQRIQQLSQMAFMFLFQKFYFNPNDEMQYEKIFGPVMARKGKPLPSFDVIRYNASLMLGNSHVSIGSSIRLPQNYKPIGGYHIDSEVKPLPEDLKKTMDESKEGVIYFSMGSNLKSKDLPRKVKRDLLNMFGQLKYTVIWKFEEVLTGVPKNVFVLQWAPQQSILSHSKCVLFITHGGLLSTTETVHFGVPIIGVPVIADQVINVLRAVQTGYALKVELSYDIAQDLRIAINEILRDPKYTEKVKELSLIYHDRPVSPRKELVHWVEHVIRTRGAVHLRSPAFMVPWYQKLYLDLLAITVALLVVLKMFVNRLYSLVCSKSSPEETNNSSKHENKGSKKKNK